MPLLWDIFLTKDIPEFDLEPPQAMNLMKILYGVCDSSDLWRQTLDSHHREDPITPMRSDPKLYIARDSHGMIQDFSGGYVDDMLRAGNEKLRQLAAKTSERFRMGDDERITWEFSGFRIEKDANGVVHNSQKQYLKQLDSLPFDAPISACRSMRVKLAWISYTRPDSMFEISQLAEVSNSMFELGKVKHIKRLNRAVKFALNHPITSKVDCLKLDRILRCILR